MTTRDEARARTMADITRIGREHLARDGAAALSLRAVTRDLGMVSSAVYRYVASRDDLLTLLVVDAYSDLAAAVAAAARPRRDPIRRVHDTAHAVRAWGVGDPARWSLLFGSPVPGYAAPAEQTTEPGTRVQRGLLADLDAAWAAGRLAPDHGPRLPRALATELRQVAGDNDFAAPETVLARALLWWAALVGVVSAEVFEAWGPTFSDPGALFAHHVRLLDEIVGVVA